jgi:hypothetical protein
MLRARVTVKFSVRVTVRVSVRFKLTLRYSDTEICWLGAQ